MCSPTLTLGQCLCRPDSSCLLPCRLQSSCLQLISLPSVLSARLPQALISEADTWAGVSKKDAETPSSEPVYHCLIVRHGSNPTDDVGLSIKTCSSGTFGPWRRPLCQGKKQHCSLILSLLWKTKVMWATPPSPARSANCVPITSTQKRGFSHLCQNISFVSKHGLFYGRVSGRRPSDNPQFAQSISKNRNGFLQHSIHYRLF